MRQFVLFIAILGSVSFLTAAEPVKNPELGAKLEVYEKMKSDLQEPMRALTKQYAAQLEKLKKDVSAKGDLDSALLAEAERKRIEAGEESQPAEGFPQLERLQRIYKNAVAAKTRPIEQAEQELERKFAANLKQYQGELTKKGNLEFAQEVQALLTSFGKKDEVEEEPEPLFVELYWQSDFEGEAVKLKIPAKVDSFAEHPTLRNDSLRSIRIPKGVLVVLGTGYALSGEQIRLRRDTKEIDLRGISSMTAE